MTVFEYSLHFCLISKHKNSLTRYFTIFEATFILKKLRVLTPNKQTGLSIFKPMLKISNICIPVWIPFSSRSMRKSIFPASFIFHLLADQFSCSCYLIRNNCAKIVCSWREKDIILLSWAKAIRKSTDYHTAICELCYSSPMRKIVSPLSFVHCIIRAQFIISISFFNTCILSLLGYIKKFIISEQLLQVIVAFFHCRRKGSWLAADNFLLFWLWSRS